MQISRFPRFMAGCLLALLLAACDDGALSQPETGARDRDGALLGAGILAAGGLGTDAKPLDFDAGTLRFIPRPLRIEKCQNLRAGIDRRWEQSETTSAKSYILKSRYSGAAHDLRQSMSVLVDSPVPDTFVTIECDRAQAKFSNVASFADRIAAAHRKSPQTYANVQRGSYVGPSGQWETIQSVQRRGKTTFDSYTAYQIHKGRLRSVSISAFRGAATKPADAELLPAGTITQINGLHGKPLTLRLTQPAWRTEDAVWGIRSAAQNQRFFKSFMDLLR